MSSRYFLTAEQRRVLLATPWGWLACGLGSGLIPKAQGSFASLVAIVPWLLLGDLPLPLYLFVLLMGFSVGVPICQQASLALGVEDHRSIVWDEFIGLWIALLPLVGSTLSWGEIAGGFVLFRLFDIYKPWPIGRLEQRLKGGLGVMIDDVLAGLFAAAVLQLIVWWIKK